MIQIGSTTDTINALAQACAPWVNVADPQITRAELDDEQWRGIASANEYEASNLGRIRHAKTHRLQPQGYRGTTTLYPAVSVDGRRYYTHQLVAQAWHGPVPGGHEVDHVDGNPFNNRPENLEYVTPRENKRRARVRLRGKRLGCAPWMDIYDAALAGQTITLRPGGCTRGHSAAEFGNRKDNQCRACKSASINIQHDITRELMRPWYVSWQAVMAGTLALPPTPQQIDTADVVDIDEYRDKSAA